MSGGIKSKRPAKRPRAEWVKLVEPLRDQGLNFNEVARALGTSRSFASSLCLDPTGEKDKLRKQSYAGKCMDCAGPTNGSDGRGKNAAKRCAACARLHSIGTRYWTRERVIASIQRWAREHDGQPPGAKDWYGPKGNGYPWASQVYRSSHRKQTRSPFASWAEAIEAAGFPRPSVGRYPRTDEWRLRMSRSRRVWSEEMIIAALRAWAKRHGRNPRFADWNYSAPGRPISHTVTRYFGSWRVALQKAGLL